MEMNLAGRTALVTGGAVRVGRAICMALAEKGCRVVVHYLDSGRQADELVTCLRSRGTEAYKIRGDLSSPAACRRIFRHTIARAGNPEILVNNAAVFQGGTLRSTGTDEWTEQLHVNLVAPVALVREFAAHVRSGRVVNILDCGIASLARGAAIYQLSKMALADFTRIAALELAPGITVNAVAPGAVLPPVGRNLGRAQKLAGPIPLGKRPDPADIASAVVYLAESDVITGQVLFVDGGRHLV